MCTHFNECLCSSLSQVDVHEELYSMADDVFESPPLSASCPVTNVSLGEGILFPSL